MASSTDVAYCGSPLTRHPRHSVERPRALTRDEANQLLERLGADSEADRLDVEGLVEFLLGTGVRIGEACALRWPAVDLDAGTLHVEATLIRIPRQGLAIQEFAKTTAGLRTVALPAFVVDLLHRRLVTPRPAAAADVVVSPAPRTGCATRTSATIRQAFDRADFVWVTSHVFRKTVATRLDEAGLSARQIADHLGRRLARPEAAAALQRLRHSPRRHRSRQPTAVTRPDCWSLIGPRAETTDRSSC